MLVGAGFPPPCAECTFSTRLIGRMRLRRRLRLPADFEIEYVCMSYDDIVASLTAADGQCDVAAAGTPVTPELCELRRRAHGHLVLLSYSAPVQG